MGIVEPTPIQARALPILFAGRDLIGQARTGSGKTLAFALPMVEKVDATIAAVQAVVLVPTRELAQQVADVVDTLAGKRVRCVRIFGGRAMGPQITALRGGPHILIGTPGRVLDLLRQGVLHLDQVRYFVLDEADEMLDRGFAPDVERILGFAPRERQTALFSATVPEWVNGTAQKHLNQPEMVAVDTAPEDVPKIDHVIYDVPEGQKLPALRVLLDGREDESVLVFGRTKHGVKKLARQLVALGYPAAALQGNLSQNARDAVMAGFRAGTMPILLATNVAARGLDVEHIGLVINYELPETPELLTHRVGRTGRMGREGDAVTLLAPSDEDKWRQLSRSIKLKLPRKRWDRELPLVPADVLNFPLYPKPEPPMRKPAAAPRPAAPAAPAGRAATGRAAAPLHTSRGHDQRTGPGSRGGSQRDEPWQREQRPTSQPIGGRGASWPTALRERPNQPAATPDSQQAWGPALSGRGSARPDRPNRFDRLPRPSRVEQPARPSGGTFRRTLEAMEEEEQQPSRKVHG